MAYNQDHRITPQSIRKDIDNILESAYEADYVTVPLISEEDAEYVNRENISEVIEELTKKMMVAASKLDFEEAAAFRDRIRSLENLELDMLGGS